MKHLGILLVLGLAMGVAGDPPQEGRRGNARYARGDYAGAAAAYRAGLEAGPTGRLRFALQHNLGLALARAGEADAAARAFADAGAAATTPAEAAAAAYNAGGVAAAAERLEEALEHYRRALRADPTDDDARYNYELVRRRLEGQRRPQQPQPGAGAGQGRPQDQPSPGQGEGQGDRKPSDADAPPEGGDPGEPQGDRPNDPAAGAPPDRMSREEAERILDALGHDEEQLLREVQRLPARPRDVEKDW